MEYCSQENGARMLIWVLGELQQILRKSRARGRGEATGVNEALQRHLTKEKNSRKRQGQRKGDTRKLLPRTQEVAFARFVFYLP